jgi:serine/threonine protein phosphatase PrpC
MGKSGTTKVKLGSSTDTGNERDHNEDSLLWWDPGNDPETLGRKGRLYVVADGMGGLAAGEVASKIAVETIVGEYARDEGNDIAGALRQAIQAANAEINRCAQSAPQQGMGTTVVCAAIRGDELYIAHAGDSRAYLFHDSVLRPLTNDHSLVNEQVRRGILTSEEAQLSEIRNVITRALGIQTEVVPDLVGPLTLNGGDSVLLCTDGICGYVSDEQIQYALRTNPRDPQAVADFLIQAANAAGGYDNATALVVLVEEAAPVVAGNTPEAQPQDAQQSANADRRLVPLLLGIGTLVFLAGLLGGLIWGMMTSLTVGLPILLDIRAQQLQPTPASFARQAADLFRGTPLPSASTLAPAPAGTPVDEPANAPTSAPAPANSAHAVQWVTCIVSLEPLQPLTPTTRLQAVPVAVIAGQTSVITVTLKTNATIVEPLTLDSEVELSDKGTTVQLQLEPQVGFNRDEQVKIDVSVVGSGAEPAHDQAMGTLTLPPQPSLLAHSKLVTVLTLKPAGAPRSAKTKVRLTARWMSAKTIPGDFKPSIAP